MSEETVVMYGDGDSPSRQGDCKHHCSPTSHPAQAGPEWVYGCLHLAFPANREHDFCPIVECGGETSKCILKRDDFKVMVGRYRGGLYRRVRNAQAKVDKYQKLMDELDELLQEQSNGKKNG